MNGAVCSKYAMNDLVLDNKGNVQIPTSAPPMTITIVDCVKYSITRPATAPDMRIRRCSPERSSRFSIENIEARLMRNNASNNSGSDFPTLLPYVEPMSAPDIPSNTGAINSFIFFELTRFVLILSTCLWPDNGFELSGPATLHHLIFPPRAGSDPARRYPE